MKKFVLRSIESMKFKDAKTGKEATDLRDIEPVLEQIHISDNIVDLIKSTVVPYEFMEEPLFRRYGYYEQFPIEQWVWDENALRKSKEQNSMESLWIMCRLLG